MSLPSIYSSSPPVSFPFWPQISLSAHYYESPQNIQFFTPLLTSAFGPRYHSQHPIMSLPTIFSSSPLCYLPILAPDITLSTLLSVSPQYTVLHSWLPFHFGTRYHSQNPIMSLRTIYSSSPSVTFTFWTHISLSAPYYESPHNIQFFIPVLPSNFFRQISLSAPYYQSPHNIDFFTPLLPSPFGPRYYSQHPIISLPTI